MQGRKSSNWLQFQQIIRCTETMYPSWLGKGFFQDQRSMNAFEKRSEEFRKTNKNLNRIGAVRSVTLQQTEQVYNRTPGSWKTKSIIKKKKRTNEQIAFLSAFLLFDFLRNITSKGVEKQHGVFF